MGEVSHKKEYNIEPEVVVKVPGITTIFGEFAYYCQGKVLCCANALFLNVSVSKGVDNQVHIFNSYTNDRKRFVSASLKFRKEDKWANYVKGVFQELSEMGTPMGGYDISLSGEALALDGAILSAAISVGVCVAMNELNGLKLNEDAIAMLCYKCCTRYCNELTKYSTIITMLKARSDGYILFDMNTLSLQYVDDPFTDKCKVLIVNCNVPPTALREELSHRHANVRDAFATLKAKTQLTSVKDFPISELTQRIVQIDEQSRRICRAVLEDSQLASSMERLAKGRDHAQIGKCMSREGVLLRDDLEISCPELDWLAKRASEVPLCYGAGIVFNGYGPYLALIIDESSIKKYREKLEDYDRIFGFKATLTVFNPCGAYEVVRNH